LAYQPSTISFSPLIVKTSQHDTVPLARRDLLDARFQLISSGHEEASEDRPQTMAEDALGFLDAPSDLVPGVYEGGLKTWECSLDLVECLHSSLGAKGDNIKGKRTRGCGTAVPSLYALHQAFSVLSSQHDLEETVFVLQDYNALVLQLVTLPNIVLAWYMSPASADFRTSYRPSTTDLDVEEEPLPPADPSQIGTLPFLPELVAAFLASLRERHITIRLFSGSWEAFDVTRAGGPFDIVLTSETIYRPESLPALVRVMRDACRGVSGLAGSLERKTEQIGIRDAKGEWAGGCAPYLCFVAAKRVYFGVGGGVAEFIAAVEGGDGAPQKESTGAKVETIWERAEGVKRIVMRVTW
ncbi:hypothetical protein C8Q72DRAFT_786592, partial [Fomitopsis betulina]